MAIPNSVEEWLLEPSDPSLRFRTMTELLGQSLSREEIAAHRRLIADSPAVRKIIGKMHPDGYWLHKKAGTGEFIGDGVEYCASSTTHYCLAYLSEMGMTKDSPTIEKAAGRYLSLMAEDGDWYLHLSCLLGFNINTFLKFGYREDGRLKKAIALLLESRRFDGGYLCDIHERKEGRKKVKSCVRGSAKALEAFAELGEAYWELSSCKDLVGYFLDRNGIFQRNDTRRFVNRDVRLLSFPFLYNSGLLQILCALSRMGYGKDNRLESAWELLERKKDGKGRYPLEWGPTSCPWNVGARGVENKWVTFYAYLAEKYRETRSADTRSARET
ncbi:MAG TPA: hypothetical protein VN445_05760 [Rectinemataceae bacterium]|nr:hypothetical protein [Rectinemataceae bacterium]